MLGLPVRHFAGPVHLPTTHLAPLSWFDSFLGYPPIKALLPIPIIAAIAPLIWLFFRETWREIDAEAELARTREGLDYRRPAACLVIVAIVLTLQEYYGGRSFYETWFRPWLSELQAHGHPRLQVDKYDEFYSYCWWVLARVTGYVLIPFPIWKLLFPKDSLLDMGLRGRGFFKHVWIYGLCLAVVIPAMLLVSRQPDFGSYYPFYKLASRSWFDFAIWEAIYGLQFFALELFFRGWIVGALRKSMGAGAIFVMAAPYCMIHYGKPYLEAHGAIVAGVVLGSLAMRTRSIYSGFLVHITVAYSMDFLALWHREALPKAFWN
ncbi:MAG TPA: type II CAAX endopeptidase family protein [Polyangiaceae bacterium]|nr:type II CAAX endopeptidase family protein [Polyangiaceae bacterium]